MPGVGGGLLLKTATCGDFWVYLWLHAYFTQSMSPAAKISQASSTHEALPLK